MSKYPQSDKEPESLGQMLAMMSNGKPSPPIEDPTTVAARIILKIFMDAKSKILLGDKLPESISAALREGRERTMNEVAHVILRQNAVKKYDEMLGRLWEGGQIEL